MVANSNQVKMDANRLGLLLRSTMDLNNWLQVNDIDGKERHRLSVILDSIFQALTNSDVVVFTDESYELFNHHLPMGETPNVMVPQANPANPVDMVRYYDNLFQSDEMMVLKDDLYTEIEDTDLVDFGESGDSSTETIVDKVQAALDAQPIDGDLHGLKASIDTSNDSDDDFFTDVIRSEEKVVQSRNDYEEKASNASLVETFSAGVDQFADEGISFDEFDEETVAEEDNSPLDVAIDVYEDLDEGFDDDLPGMSTSSVLSNSFSSFDEDFIGSDFFDEGSDA